MGCVIVTGKIHCFCGIVVEMSVAVWGGGIGALGIGWCEGGDGMELKRFLGECYGPRVLFSCSMGARREVGSNHMRKEV